MYDQRSQAASFKGLRRDSSWLWRWHCSWSNPCLLVVSFLSPVRFLYHQYPFSWEIWVVFLAHFNQTFQETRVGSPVPFYGLFVEMRVVSLCHLYQVFGGCPEPCRHPQLWWCQPIFPSSVWAARNDMEWYRLLLHNGTSPLLWWRQRSSSAW